MKKIISVILLLVTIFNLTGCKDSKDPVLNDALKFKEEYESLNGDKNSGGIEYRTLSISEENPVIYKSADDIVQMMNNKETFVVYFGFASCPWCRSVIPTLINCANDMNIETIYYVDVKEIRDTIVINDDGELETSKKGTDGYYELINLLDKVLEEYTLIDNNGNKVSTGEKRIFAPNVVAVVDGQVQKLESGISEKQTDSNMNLTDEMQDETYSKYKTILGYITEKQNTCNEGC